MKRISKTELIAIFKSGVVNGATFIGLDTITEPTLTGGKSNPHKGRVLKIVEGSNVMVFQNKNVNGYKNMVQRRLQSEGKNPQTFELKPRTWGVRIDGTPLVEHKGQHYLEVIFLKAGETSYRLDHKPVQKSAIQGLPERKDGGQGGLENLVIIRSYKLDSLVRVTLDKEVYLIED